VQLRGEQNNPAAQWGGRNQNFYYPSLYEAAGVYDVNPSLQSADDNGFKLGTVNSTGAIIFNEIGLTAHVGPEGLVGHYKIGGYHDTSNLADIGDSKIEVNGTYTAICWWTRWFIVLSPAPLEVLSRLATQRSVLRNSCRRKLFRYRRNLYGILASRPHDTLALGWIMQTSIQIKLNEEDAALEKAGALTLAYTRPSKLWRLIIIIKSALGYPYIPPSNIG